MSLRIAMVAACPYPVPQGSQVLLKDTAVTLSRRGHEVRLVVYGYGSGDDDSGLTIHRCASPSCARKLSAGPFLAKPFLDVALTITLRRVVDAHCIGVLHAHNYEGLLAALTARKRPIIYHAHNAMADELPFYFRAVRSARAFGRWLDRTFPRRADHVIAPHHALAEYLIAQGCTPAQVSVIPPAAHPELFEAGAVCDEVPPVLYTGNLDAYQNLPFLSRVMDRVRKRLPGARWLVATAEDRSVAGAEVVRTPNFESLRRLLNQDAVVACPRASWSGYPIKLLNAMAAAKAVVACRSAAHPLAHEHNGLVVDDNDEAAFAEALLRLLRDPDLRARLGQNARATAVLRHNPDVMATAIERVYQSVMGKSST